MASHVTFCEQKQFHSQKHFNLRSPKSQPSETLAGNRDGSAIVVQRQSQETKGPIKINAYNEKEKASISTPSPKSSGNRKAESEAFSDPGHHRDAPCTPPPEHVSSAREQADPEVEANRLRLVTFSAAFE